MHLTTLPLHRINSRTLSPLLEYHWVSSCFPLSSSSPSYLRSPQYWDRSVFFIEGSLLLIFSSRRSLPLSFRHPSFTPTRPAILEIYAPVAFWTVSSTRSPVQFHFQIHCFLLLPTTFIRHLPIATVLTSHWPSPLQYHSLHHGPLSIKPHLTYLFRSLR